MTQKKVLLATKTPRSAFNWVQIDLFDLEILIFA